MLHYHPISSTGGGELVVSLHVAVYRIMCLKERKKRTVALAYRPAIGLSFPLPNSPDLALPHLSRSGVLFQQLICSTTLLYLSLSLSVSPSPLVLLALSRFTLGLITVHCCTHATNNGSPGLLSATSPPLPPQAC